MYLYIGFRAYSESLKVRPKTLLQGVVGWRVDGFRYPLRRSMGFFPPDSSAFIGWQIVNFKSWHPWVLIGLWWVFLRMLVGVFISTRRSTSDSFPHVSCVCESERGYNSIHFTTFCLSEFCQSSWRIAQLILSCEPWTAPLLFLVVFFPGSLGYSLNLLLVRQTLCLRKTLLLASCQVVKTWFWLCSHRVFAADLRLQRFRWVELE